MLLKNTCAQKFFIESALAIVLLDRIIQHYTIRYIISLLYKSIKKKSAPWRYWWSQREKQTSNVYDTFGTKVYRSNGWAIGEIVKKRWKRDPLHLLEFVARARCGGIEKKGKKDTFAVDSCQGASKPKETTVILYYCSSAPRENEDQLVQAQHFPL